MGNGRDTHSRKGDHREALFLVACLILFGGLGGLFQALPQFLGDTRPLLFDSPWPSGGQAVGRLIVVVIIVKIAAT